MFRQILTMTAMISLNVAGNDNSNGEPNCYSRYDYDYKLMQTLSELQNEQQVLKTRIYEQSTKIDYLQNELKETVKSQWGEWSTWSKCTFKCTGSEEGRQQSRERSRSQTDSGTLSEIESRPCNAVQYAGCVKNHGPGDQYGVTYDFADQIAVSTCTSLPEAVGYIYAVRRQCSNLSVSCEETCKSLQLKCFNSIHVHRGSTTQKQDDVGKLGLYLYRYNSCAGSYCGPNFCCCRK
ncbi:hypothetical protein ACF0H5_011326 [Mactra antiquata]